MTLTELRTTYKRLYRTLQKERFMRMKVFPPGHAKHGEKLGEIDQALADVTAIKDAIKVLLDETEPTQAPLIDVPNAPSDRHKLGF